MFETDTELGFLWGFSLWNLGDIVDLGDASLGLESHGTQILRLLFFITMDGILALDLFVDCKFDLVKVNHGRLTLIDLISL